MVESGRVPGKGRIGTSIEKLSPRLPEKGRICVSTEKWENPYEYRKTVPAINGKVSNLCEYRKMVESGRVSGKARIGTSIEKLSPRLPEKCRICVSTEKW